MWDHAGPRVYVHVRMRCTWMRYAWYERKCVAEPDSQIGGVIAGVDCYMAWLTASQIEHTTFAVHPAYSRYEWRQTWIKSVSLLLLTFANFS